jgi:hypothetical protein
MAGKSPKKCALKLYNCMKLPLSGKTIRYDEYNVNPGLINHGLFIRGVLPK